MDSNAVAFNFGGWYWAIGKVYSATCFNPWAYSCPDQHFKFLLCDQKCILLNNKKEKNSYLAVIGNVYQVYQK